MKRRLSGWARLWIVFAVLTWAGGAWLLYDNPMYRYRTPDPCLFDLPFGNVIEPTPEEEAEYSRCREAEARHYRENKAAIDAQVAERERVYQFQIWSRVVAVALAPFIVAGILWFLWRIALWVWRGFRREDHR